MSEPPSHRLRRAKQALRREVRALRDAMPEAERARRSRIIAERLVSLPEVRHARTVMAFWSFGSEVDTAPLIERLQAAGKRVALPRIEGRDVVPIAYEPGARMSRASFGAMEPAGGEVVRPWDLDVVVTPGLAFDRRGNRAGYGRGFYDRLFRRLRPDAPRIAIGFGIQIVDEVPAGRDDRPVDAIVTEDEVIRCR